MTYRKFIRLMKTIPSKEQPTIRLEGISEELTENISLDEWGDRLTRLGTIDLKMVGCEIMLDFAS